MPGGNPPIWMLGLVPGPKPPMGREPGPKPPMGRLVLTPAGLGWGLALGPVPGRRNRCLKETRS